METFVQVPKIRSPNPLYPTTLVTVLLCSILTTIFTAARLITKRLMSKYNIEDYFLIAAWATGIAYSFVLLAAGLGGLGRHIWDIQATDWPKLAKFGWSLEILYIPGIWLAKASLLFQLIRIFTPMKSGLVYWACHTLIWSNLAFYISILLTLIFECHPISEVWNPTYVYGNHCIDRNMVLFVSSAVNVLSDLLNILLPLWATWHLQMAPKRKVGVSAIFATGLLAFVSSICRLVFTTHIVSSDDIFYTIAQTALWALAEIATIILCTCFPMMPRFVKLVSDHSTSLKLSSVFSSRRSPKGILANRSRTRSSRHARDTGLHEEDMARLKSPYEQLGKERDLSTAQNVQVERHGIRKTVDIELGSLDQPHEPEDRVSMV